MELLQDEVLEMYDRYISSKNDLLISIVEDVITPFLRDKGVDEYSSSMGSLNMYKNGISISNVKKNICTSIEDELTGYLNKNYNNVGMVFDSNLNYQISTIVYLYQKLCNLRMIPTI